MQYGYQCEECETAAWPATSRQELVWLKNREHIVREVAGHVQTGLDQWMLDALEFLDKHHGHSVIITRRGP